jgi:hypothetical protein
MVVQLRHTSSASELGQLGLLPLELRNAIFEMVLMTDYPQTVGIRFFGKRSWDHIKGVRIPGFLAASRMSRAETLPIYYFRNNILVRVQAFALDEALEFLEHVVATIKQIGLDQRRLRVNVDLECNIHDREETCRED